MARLATRPVRGLVALLFVATGTFVVSNFSMLGGSVPRAPAASRIATHASSVQLPASASTAQTMEAMESIYEKIAIVKSLLQGRTSLAAIHTQQQLEEYDQKLSADIQMLENLVQDSMEVGTTTEVEWFENILETVGDLKAQLARHRAAEGHVTLPAAGVMPMFLTLGVLLFLAGSASFATIEQTRDIAFSQATNVRSYWQSLTGSAKLQGMTHEPLAPSRNLTF